MCINVVLFVSHQSFSQTTPCFFIDFRWIVLIRLANKVACLHSAVFLCGRVVTVATSHTRGFEGSLLRASKHDSGCHPSEAGEMSCDCYKQWVTAVEDCECKPQVWEERRPGVLDTVKNHFTCGLKAVETDIALLRKSKRLRFLILIIIFILSLHNFQFDVSSQLGGWFSLVVTQPSSGHQLLCVRCVCVWKALSYIRYRGAS